MPPLANLLAFTATALVIVLIPGPSLLFAIGRALSIGRVGALFSVAGNATGFMVQVAVIAVGLGAVLQESIVVLTIVKFVGAAVVIFLGVQAIRHRKRPAGIVTSAEPRSHRRSYVEGMVVGITNPKTIVFFAAVLPQFVDPAGIVPLQLAVFGAIFGVLALLCDSAWALAAARARDWFGSSPKRLERLGVAGGVALIGLGVGVAVSGATD